MLKFVRKIMVESKNLTTKPLNHDHHDRLERKMSLQKSDVEKIAHLARLSISEDDIASYTDNLSTILNLVDQLNAADTDQISPMAHPQDATQRLREDIVTESNQRDNLLKNAPSTEDGLFLVPKVIE